MANAADSGTIQIGALTYALGSYDAAVKTELNNLTSKDVSKRLWSKDASLWTNKDESEWLGWLDIVKEQLANTAQFDQLSKSIKEKGYQHAVLLGMGGSSLCVEVMRHTFGSAAGHPQMIVLDSVVPAQVKAVRTQIDPAKTVFIVASKSGSTTEPNVLCQYFYEETKKAVGDKVGDHFIAITDPGSSMEKRARELKFAHVFYGVPSIGGRFSALSNFGMIPAAVMGLNTTKLLEHAQAMVNACSESNPPAENPGILLGAILGTLTKLGRDKITIVTSPAVHSLGTWLEQLIAESTGKEGKGLIPIAAEPLELPAFYGSDRVFVYIRLSTSPSNEHDSKIEVLEKAGQPVIRITMSDKMHLGSEFFRWEVATAIAGSVLGINAFNQPNVQESKDFTKQYLAEYAEEGVLPENRLLYSSGGFELFGDDDNIKQLKDKSGNKDDLKELLLAHLSRIKSGDYFAISAYIECCPRLEAKLQKIREYVMKKNKVASTVGFGPRFLHSTGQLHKGGPNSGVFLQITCDDKEDVEIPGEPFTFSILKEAQALGDFQALSSRKRRLLRLHLPADVDSALDKVYQLISGK